MKPKTDWDWYWRVPFNDPKSPFSFDRSHWWKNNAKSVSEIAAWYELLRRHPAVGAALQTRSEVGSGEWETECFVKTLTRGEPPEDKLLNLLQVIGRKPWPRLSKENKDAFIRMLAKTRFGKGCNRGAEARILFDPTSLQTGFDWTKLLRRDAERFCQFLQARRIEHDENLKTGQKRTIKIEPVAILGARNWFTKFFDALRQRKLVLSIDFETDDPIKTANALAKEYLSAHARLHPDPGRPITRGQQWLTTIHEFEKSESDRLARSVGVKHPAKRRENQNLRLRFQRLFDDIEF